MSKGSNRRPAQVDNDKFNSNYDKIFGVSKVVQPWCQCQHHVGQKVKANVVDHIKPHKGDSKLFWNPKNLQSMLKVCHDKYKQSQEKGGLGFDIGCDAMGNPSNPMDHWK